MAYTAIAATEWKQDGGANGIGGKMKKIIGAFTVDPNGRKCRAFNEREGGLIAAQAWACTLNERAKNDLITSRF